MIRTLYFTEDGQLRRDIPTSQFAEVMANPHCVFWVDFQGNPPEQDEPLLREIFHFHPLAIDDALAESHVPKVDDWGEYLYIVLHGVKFQPHGNDEMIHTQELDIFLGSNYMVTHHDETIAALDHVWDTIQRDDRHLKSGADHLLYRVADEVIASYMPVVEALDEEIDITEDQVFDRPEPRTLEHIFQLKRAALHLRRIVGPQREALNKLARDDYPVIDARDRVYFRDVYDHLVRLHDLTESIRDLVSGSLDTYLSVINNRMNEIMKTLTIITTLFMPISFVASFYGMNFFQPVEPGLGGWTSSPVFYLTLGLIILSPAMMFWWMHRRNWM